MEGFKVRIECLVMVENLITEIKQYRLTRSQLQKEKELKLRFPMKQVISFNSHNVVFEAYWLKNLKGFFRLTERVFVPEY